MPFGVKNPHKPTSTTPSHTSTHAHTKSHNRDLDHTETDLPRTPKTGLNEIFGHGSDDDVAFGRRGGVDVHGRTSSFSSSAGAVQQRNSAAGIFGANIDQMASVDAKKRSSFKGLFSREGGEVRGNGNSGGGDNGMRDGGNAGDLDSIDDVSWSEGAGMYVYVCVCVCMCMNVYVHVHIHT
jgi:hypothetical protein